MYADKELFKRIYEMLDPENSPCGGECCECHFSAGYVCGTVVLRDIMKKLQGGVYVEGVQCIDDNKLIELIRNTKAKSD